MNQLIIDGYIASDLQLKQSKSGKPYCSFTLANSIGYGDNKKTSFITFVIWDKQAEFLCNYKKKGDFVYVNNASVSISKGDDGKYYTTYTAHDISYPPLQKVEATQIKKDYGKVPDLPPVDVNAIAHETGQDGSINPQQLEKSKEKPYIKDTPFKEVIKEIDDISKIKDIDIPF